MLKYDIMFLYHFSLSLLVLSKSGQRKCLTSGLFDAGDYSDGSDAGLVEHDEHQDFTQHDICYSESVASTYVKLCCMIYAHRDITHILTSVHVPEAT